jgi:hypothetical protein
MSSVAAYMSFVGALFLAATTHTRRQHRNIRADHLLHDGFIRRKYRKFVGLQRLHSRNHSDVRIDVSMREIIDPSRTAACNACQEPACEALWMITSPHRSTISPHEKRTDPTQHRNPLVKRLHILPHSQATRAWWRKGRCIVSEVVSTRGCGVEIATIALLHEIMLDE